MLGVGSVSRLEIRKFPIASVQGLQDTAVFTLFAQVPLIAG